MTKRKIDPNIRPFWRKSKLPTAVVCAALGCAAVWYAKNLYTGAESLLSDGEAKHFAFSWKNGSTYTYGLSWRARQVNRLLQANKAQDPQATRLAGSVNAQAELVLRSYGKAGDVHVLGLSLAHISQLEWEVLGERVVKDDKLLATFDEREAFLEVQPDGRIRQTFFASDTPTEFRGFVQWLAPQLQFVLPHGEAEWSAQRWQVAEDTSHGRARSAYTLAGSAPLTLARVRASYESLLVDDIQKLKYTSDDRAEARCAAEGHLEHIDSHIKLDVSEEGEAAMSFESSFALELKSVTDGPARNMLALHGQAFQGYAPTATPDTESANHTALVNRVGKLSAGQMVSDVLEFANGGRMDQKWLWQATGLLQLNPEACAELAAVFDDPGFTAKGRGLILDLLASAGSDEAQAALRKLLDSKAAGSDETERAILFNRVGLVSEANADTAEFVKQHFEALKEKPLSPMRVASAYALGSVASQQRELGNKAQAEALNATLVDTLEEASAPEEKAVMLRAMGNAAMPENVDTLAEYTRHASSDVRAAAATALRDTHTETSMQALLELLKDPEWPVQQAALATLSGYTLPAAEAQQVEDLVVSGVVGSRNDPLLVTVLARNATPEHPLLASLGHVLARNQQNGQLAARIRSVARRNGVTL